MSVELYREIVSVMLPSALLAYFDVVDVKMRLFAPGEQLDAYPISASSLEKYYYADGHQLERQYEEYLSGYEE